MGSGSSKPHEAFAVTPSATALTVTLPQHPTGPTAPTGATTGPPPAAAADTLATTSSPPAATAAPTAAPTTTTPAPIAADPPTATAVTPVPATAPLGSVAGTPLLVGGADLDDSLATLVAYDSPDGPREVLYAVVAERAEPKVFEALDIQEQKTIPVQVDKQVHERLELDQAQQLHEQLETIVKSTNHHLKAGDGIPAKTQQAYAKLTSTLATLSPPAGAAATTKAMLAHYEAAAAQIGQRLQPDFTTPYAEGGKVPFIAPYTVAKTVTVTELVPAPPDFAPDGMLPTTVRKATRIAPQLAGDTASWDGTSRKPVDKGGVEYVADLGDGYQAVYRRHGGAQPTVFSYRGSLEIVAPPGGGHGPELIRRLGQLNLVNRPMSPLEGEWAYLQRNIWAQQLDQHKQVAAALNAAQGLEDALWHDLVAERADEAVGLNETALASFAKNILLEAEAQALPHKVRVVRDAIATSMGLVDGEALTASPRYDPAPRHAGGWFVWHRFDVDPAKVDAQFAGHCLSHNISGNNLVDVLRSGVLASVERRRTMGVKSGLGKSEGTDMDSGGAKTVFLRVSSHPNGIGLHWQQPSRLLRRADWYAYPDDHYGNVNPHSSHTVSGQTRDPAVAAKFTSGSNEVMFRNGIGLLGDEAPSRITCGSNELRASVLAMFATQGVTKLGGKPIHEVVTIS